MEQIIDHNYGRTDVFEIVTDFPPRHVIWNIGRENFQHPGFIPIAETQPRNKYYIRLDTLKALRLEDEDLCLHLLKKAHHKQINLATFREIVADWESKKAQKILQNNV